MALAEADARLAGVRADLESKLAASEAARAEAEQRADELAEHLSASVKHRTRLREERDRLRSDPAFEREALVVACQERDAARADAEDEREARHAAETLLEYERNALTAERDESDKALLSVWDLGEGRGMGGAMLAAGVPADPGSNVAAIIKARARQALAAKGDATRG
jgi:hypothetical protein